MRSQETCGVEDPRKDITQISRETKNPILFDERAVAEYLGVSPKTLQSWRLRGVGPVYRKIGRLVKYLKNDIDDYIQQQGRRSTSEV